MIEVEALPLWANSGLFAVAAALIWAAGSRIAWYADAISERTGLGQAFLGALFLGGITSLPEGAATISAAAFGNAPLAVSNLFGGVAMQVAILAVIDGVARGRPLSGRVDEAAVMLYGVLALRHWRLCSAWRSRCSTLQASSCGRSGSCSAWDSIRSRSSRSTLAACCFSTMC